MNIPNAITLSRICAVPVIVWLILDRRMDVAFWLALAAALSDALDGIVAKRFKMETVLGAFLDPIADKALLVCAYVALGHEGYLPFWLVILVVFRDALIIGGAILFHTLTQSLEMSPLMISKINTVAQLVLAVTVVGSEAFGLQIDAARQGLIYLVGATTFASGAVYVVSWTRLAGEIEGAEGSDDDG
ncbi:MAG: CDP-alcohol phosphatidyltransferase family protein [Magnetovibrio sp.]|nr:CDP-alcohol phosphatidyltransferase family protein [Magnetovibrio sp.]